MLCSNIRAQSDITVITTTTVSGTSTSNTGVIIPSDALQSLTDDRGEEITVNYGQGNNLRVVSYEVGGNVFDNFLTPDTLVLNRTSPSDRLVNIWLTLTNTIVDNTPPTPNVANLDGDEVVDADAIYLSNNLNAGYDNILTNIDDGAAGSIEVETERVDVIWYSGIQSSSPSTAVFPIIERGGNDNVAVAVITSLNSDGTPASYGNLIGIGEDAWPGFGPSFNNYLILRRESAGSTPLPLINIGTDVGQTAQTIQGVAISFSEFGVAANQSIFGYSIFSADVVDGYTSNTGQVLTTGDVSVAAGIDLTDIATFPTTSRANDSGLDLVAGVSAAVASDDNLIETIGPGGYKPNNVLRTWLKANDGAFVSNGGAASTEGNSVGFWEDQSVADNDFTTLTTAPTFRSSTSSINFNPTVDFLNGTETGLLTPNSDDYNQNGPYTKKSINIAFRTSGDISTRQQIFEEGGGTNGLGIHIDGGTLYGSVWNRGNSSSTGAPWNDATPTSFVSTSVATDTEYILTLEFDGNTSTTGTITLYLNGQSFGSLSSIGLLYNHTGAIGLGDVNGASRYHNNTTAAGSYRGEIAEFIYCNDPAALTSAGRNRIESYLAIKYGITLDQSSPINYVNSNGDIIFNTTNSAALGGYLEYNNDIAGIGRDDDSELDQPASRSENSGSVVTIDRGTSISTDDTWLIWGNDGAALTETSGLTMPDTIDSRLSRVWRVAEENEVLTTSVSFDITGLGLSTNEDDFSLLIASNSSGADFSNATVLTGGTLIGNTLTFDGVDLEDGEYFTLGTDFAICSPGGVETNLRLWLRADEQVFNSGTTLATDGQSVETWGDASVGENDATDPSDLTTFETNTVNFNPAIQFNNDATSLEGSFTTTTAGMTLFSAANIDASSGTIDALFEVRTGTDQLNRGYFAEQRYGTTSNNFSTTLNNDAWSIFSVDHPSGNTADIYQNGAIFENNYNAVSFAAAAGTYNYTLGDDDTGANEFTGFLGEVIVYEGTLSPTDRQKVQSYLAVKYGVTIDQGSATDYLAADGGIIWNATDNSGYANDIAGIGRDDLSCFEQKQSKSENSGSIVTMGLGEIAATNNANPNSFANDDAFLIWGNDGASATEANSVTYTEGVITERMLKVWRADENAGTVGATDISFDLTGLGYTGSLSDYNLIISDASGLTSPTIVPATSFAGDVVTFSDIDLADGQFFTLGTARTNCSPGGVDTDLYVWLRADAGTSTTTDNTTLSTWTDQAGNANAVTDGNPPLFKNNTTDNINFNPTIDFDGTDDRLDLGNLANIKSGAANAGDYTLVSVGIRQTSGNTQYILGSPGGSGNQDLHFGYRNNTSATIAHWGNDLDVAVAAFDSPETAPFLLAAEYDGSIRSVEETRSGAFGRSTESETVDLQGTRTNYIGDVENLANYNGLISEVIIFDNDITDLQKQQVYTYLAIKYGITLTNDADNDAITNEVISGSVREGDYVASDGSTIIWTYADNTTYSNDIAGIGRDDDGCFVQKQSTAEDTDDILTVGLGSIASSNGANANGFDDDRDYFVWGNDNGATDRNSGGLETSDVPATISERMTRVWKAQDTGNVGETELQFDLTGTNFSTADASSYSLLISDVDGDMTNATIVTGGSFNGDVLSFSGVDLTDGQFFTIGTAFVTCGPGGVNDILSLWVRADLETFSDGGSTAAVDGNNVLQWNDQSSPQINASEVDLGGGASAIEPTLQTGEVNFNPVIRFSDPNSSNASYYTTSSTAVTGDLTLISVFKTGQAQGTDEDALNSPALVSARNGGTLDYSMGIQGGTVWLDADSDEGFEVQTTGTYNNNTAHIATAVKSGTALSLFIDAENVGTGTGVAALTSATGFGIGNHFNSDLQAQFAGDIAETIVFTDNLDSDQRNRVESYLALKYGLTMNASDDGSTGGVDERDYRAADGDVIWDFDGQGTTYYNDIFGIGRDDLSCLSQTSSKSENSDALVTFTEPDGSFDNNDSFIVSGNDNAAIEDSDNTELDKAEVQSRLNREWRVQETGTLDDIEVTFDLSTITGPLGVGTNNLTQLRLMVDDDGDFSNGGTTYISPSAIDGGGNSATFTVDFTDGQYYTLGSIEVAALPITLISFEVEVNDENQVQLDWVTASETNNAFFTIENSTDGVNFNEVANLDGAGNSDAVLFYTYTHTKPANGLSFYRLKQTDFSGEFEYSEIRSVRVESQFQTSYRAYPNPIRKGETLRISYQIEEDKELQFIMFNRTGKIIRKEEHTALLTEEYIELSTKGFDSGLNMIRIVDQSGTATTLKVIIK